MFLNLNQSVKGRFIFRTMHSNSASVLSWLDGMGYMRDLKWIRKGLWIQTEVNDAGVVVDKQYQHILLCKYISLNHPIEFVYRHQPIFSKEQTTIYCKTTPFKSHVQVFCWIQNLTKWYSTVSWVNFKIIWQVITTRHGFDFYLTEI